MAWPTVMEVITIQVLDIDREDALCFICVGVYLIGMDLNIRLDDSNKTSSLELTHGSVFPGSDSYL